ncbi:MAG: RpoL/Rpb11 RNA polymerase subunit family protein [Candidatus Geothermarchaeales archaeon]
MDLQILSVKKGRFRFKIVGEDYTLGNLLQEILLKDKRVKGAGFKAPHPLKKEIVMDVFLDVKEPVKVIKENIEILKKYLEDINEEIAKAVEGVAET